MKRSGDKPAVRVEALSFTYPGGEREALVDLSFDLEPASFVLVAGPGGSGKTTLLRALKAELRPTGTFRGKIQVEGNTGFVMQDPDNQIVMDQVWHELAFGLENQGLSPAVIERRIAEISHFFGIGDWIERPVSKLSGGERQILNLASSLVMKPDILILDEPTARLDPVAISHFLDMLRRIHRETGTTLILSEHRLADLLPEVDRVLHLDGGRLTFDGTPTAFAARLLATDRPFKESLPAATLTVERAEKTTGMAVNGDPPLDVPAARRRLRVLASMLEVEPPKPVDPASDQYVIQMDRLEFRYGRDWPKVLDGVDLAVRKGSVHAILGANGSGKSTLLYLLAGVLDPLRGRVRKLDGIRTGLLVQHPRSLFSADRLLDELMELAELGGYGEAQVKEEMERLGLWGLRKRHPYDLSGGESQKAALAKLLLLSPDVFLLDEPVQGMDATSKIEFGRRARALKEEGRTVVLVTHDLNFSAEVADTCSLLFGGRIVTTEDSRSFFRDNRFYTTDYARVAEGLWPELLAAADLERLVRRTGHA